MDEIQKCLGERIVLTLKSEICYAGAAVKVLNIDGVDGLLVKIDDQSGFAVFCPRDFIKEIVTIPIPKEGC